MTTLQMIGCTAALAAVGSVYVLLELASRKQRKERKETEELEGGEGSSNSLTADKLVEVLGESARAAYSLIEQTRKMVQQKHQETGQPLETCVDELQKGFESASTSAGHECARARAPEIFARALLLSPCATNRAWSCRVLAAWLCFFSMCLSSLAYILFSHPSDGLRSLFLAVPLSIVLSQWSKSSRRSARSTA